MQSNPTTDANEGSRPRKETNIALHKAKEEQHLSKRGESSLMNSSMDNADMMDNVLASKRTYYLLWSEGSCPMIHSYRLSA